MATSHPAMDTPYLQFVNSPGSPSIGVLRSYDLEGRSCQNDYCTEQSRSEIFSKELLSFAQVSFQKPRSISFTFAHPTAGSEGSC